LRKYISNLNSWLFYVFLAVVLIVMLSVNISLEIMRPKVVEFVNNKIPYKVSFGKIFYIVPNIFIVKDVVLSDRSDSSDSTPVLKTTLLARVSLTGLLPDRNFSLSEVMVFRPKMNYFRFCAFLRDNGEEILEIFSQFPLQDVKSSMRWAKMDLAQGDAKSPGHIITSFAFKLKGDAVFGNGMIRQDQYRYDPEKKDAKPRTYLGLPLSVNAECKLRGKKLFIEMVTLERKNLYAKLWGKCGDGLLTLNGFTFLNTIAKEKDFQDPSIADSIKWVKSFLSGLKKHKSRHDLLEKGIYILDIDSKIKLDFPVVEIEKLNFSLNNAPVNITGNILFYDPVGVNLKAAVYSPRTALENKDYFKKADLVIDGRLTDNAFTSDGFLNLSFTKRPDKRSSLEKLEIDFNKLALYLDKHSLLRVRLGNGKISCKTDSSSQRVALKDFEAAFNLQMDRFTFVEVYSPLYGGFLHGRVWIDTEETPLRVHARAKVRDVDANQLKGLAESFSKVEGGLSGKMNFESYPSPRLYGAITIENGKLKNLDFFHWLADTFNLPSVRTVNFKKGIADFFIATQETGLKNIRIRSPETKIDGSLSVKEGNLISSKLKLSLNRDLLQQSAKFRPFLRQLDENIDFLSFDFQLSGYVDAVNFQWLETDLKNEIQSMIPDFIERKIERNVDKALEPVEQKNEQLKERVVE